MIAEFDEFAEELRVPWNGKVYLVLSKRVLMFQLIFGSVRERHCSSNQIMGKLLRVLAGQISRKMPCRTEGLPNARGHVGLDLRAPRGGEQASNTSLACSNNGWE